MFHSSGKQSPSNACYVVKMRDQKSEKRGLKNLRVYQKSPTIPRKPVHWFPFLTAEGEVVLGLTLGQVHLGGCRGQPHT